MRGQSASCFPAFSFIPVFLRVLCALGASGLFQPLGRRPPALLPSISFRAKAAKLAKRSQGLAHRMLVLLRVLRVLGASSFVSLPSQFLAPH
jgi:hypothetical protein